MLPFALLVLPFLAPMADASVQADEKLVRDAGFRTDAAGLRDFFRQRSLDDTARKECVALIRQFGSRDYEQRQQASKKLTQGGAGVIPLLKDALTDDDAEVARRAKACLDAIAAANPGVPIAAARLLLRRDPDEAVPTLLSYLPYAANEWELEDYLALLVEAWPPPGKTHAALTAALRDPLPIRRAVAAYVLGRKGAQADHDEVRKLLADKSPLVRFRAAQGLLAVGDKDAVPALLKLLEDGPLNVAWQVEDIFYSLAANKGPTVALSVDSDNGARRKCREAWVAWWKDNEPTVDLKRYLDGERRLGLTLGIEWNTGRVWECGRDKAVRWEIKGLLGPMDAQVLPNGLVLIAESNNQTVSVRDFKGNIRWEKKLDHQPTGCQRLPNGNTFISSFGSVLELDAKGEPVYGFDLTSGSNAIWKHRNGHVLYARESEIIEVDTTGKRMRSIPLPHAGCTGIQDLPGDRFLVVNSKSGQVLELDNSGKVLGEWKVPGACGATRLPNGHTLVATDGAVLELDDKGKTVWEKATEGYVRRVHRR